MREPGAVEAAAILTIVEVGLVLRRRRPFRARRSLRHVDVPLALLRHEHAEANLLSVRRPPHVADRFAHARHLRHGDGSLHVANEQLRAARLTVIEKREARSVGRPARVGSFAEKPVARAIGIHDPERRVPAILHLVHVAPRVHNLGAIGRDLGIGDLLVVEILLDGEERVGGLLLAERRDDGRNKKGDSAERKNSE